MFTGFICPNNLLEITVDIFVRYKYRLKSEVCQQTIVRDKYIGRLGYYRAILLNRNMTC